MTDFWAIILAAGESKRMGKPKMLLPFKGSSIIENVIANIKGSRVRDIMIVLGADSEFLTPMIQTKDVNYCYNVNYRDGMLSSVICGLNSIPPDHEAIIVFQGDQPLISPVVTDAVIESYLSTRKGIVIPVYNKKRGHPILIDRKYTNDIRELNPMEGLRSLLFKFPEDVLEVETDEAGILRDFDTPDEYRKGVNQIQ